MTSLALPQGRAVVLSSGAVESLKWIALACMVVDHVNAIWFGRELGTWATAAGRLAMPLFAVVLGYNLARPGADLAACLRRLLLFGALATPAYIYLFGLVDWWPLNIMATFAVAVGVILLFERGDRSQALGLLVVGGALVEYWWPGVALVLLARWYFRRPVFDTAAYASLALLALCLVNGKAWALLALPVVAAVATSSPSVPRCGRFFWWFYPAHLVALAGSSVLVP